jgi:hypothetical protein
MITRVNQDLRLELWTLDLQTLDYDHHCNVLLRVITSRFRRASREARLSARGVDFTPFA